MKKFALAASMVVISAVGALAADLPVKARAPIAPAPTWTGFYVFGGGGGGIWAADSRAVSTFPGVSNVVNNRQGGDGWFGTVGAGYDWQFSPTWVAGVFADGQFGSLKGNLSDSVVIGIASGLPGIVGTEKMKSAWAAGARLGYLVAPNVLSYVNAGYTNTYWSGSTLLNGSNSRPSGLHTNKFNTGGAFVGGGFENSLSIFGISAPGWHMKTEYRAAYLDRETIPELLDTTGAVFAARSITFKPMVQTVSTSLVYRWGSQAAQAADMPVRARVAPVMAQSWTGFYAFGGGGGGKWDADSRVISTAAGAGGSLLTNNRQGGDGWFGTVGAGYDWQFNPSWVAGVFADGQFGSLKGNISDAVPATLGIVGTEKMKSAWAAGARLGYLVAPNVLSYVNGGYTNTYWSATTLLDTANSLPSGLHTNKFDTGGGFVGAGMENSLSIFGISAPNWHMKTEYRAAYLGKENLVELLDTTGASFGRTITFKPMVQTISTALVYRFH